MMISQSAIVVQLVLLVSPCWSQPTKPCTWAELLGALRLHHTISQRPGGASNFKILKKVGEAPESEILAVARNL